MFVRGELHFPLLGVSYYSPFLGNSIHYVSSSVLGQIVQFSNHILVLKLVLVVREIIEVMMYQSLGTHGNRLRSGPGTKTDILNYLLIKSRLSELI